MNEALAVFKISWEQGFVYRLNFAFWRMRTILQLLLVYFIWWSVFQSQEEIFGYTQAGLLTYVLVSVVIRAIVLSSRAADVGNQINDGSIVNFMIKPMGLIKYYFVRDIADKLLNICFVFIEIILLLILLKPEIIIQTNIGILLSFFIAIILGVIINFCISLIFSLSAFWAENSWGPMFLMGIFLDGFGGTLFPIDILPKNIFNLLMLTPFPYLVYFPSRLYIGTFQNSEICYGFGILIFWVICLVFLTRIILDKGLRHFSAVGN